MRKTQGMSLEVGTKMILKDASRPPGRISYSRSALPTRPYLQKPQSIDLSQCARLRWGLN